MNLWPSRGMELVGMEVKISRSDWLRELRDPAKSAEVQKYCDRWWLVAPDREVVRPDEVPATWGLMTIHGRRGLVAVKDAPKLEAAPLDRPFVAAMGRRMAESVAQATALARQALDGTDDFERGHKEGLEEAKRKDASDLVHLRRAQEAIEEFEGRSGLQINDYNGAQLGDAVAELLRARRGHPVSVLKQQEDTLRRLADGARQAREAIEGFVAASLPTEGAA